MIPLISFVFLVIVPVLNYPVLRINHRITDQLLSFHPQSTLSCIHKVFVDPIPSDTNVCWAAMVVAFNILPLTIIMPTEVVIPALPVLMLRMYSGCSLLPNTYHFLGHCKNQGTLLGNTILSTLLHVVTPCISHPLRVPFSPAFVTLVSYRFPNTSYQHFNLPYRINRDEKKWMVVNIQCHEEFSSHMLNRDTWTDDTVISLLRTSFVFWQRGHTSGDAQVILSH